MPLFGSVVRFNTQHMMRLITSGREKSAGTAGALEWLSSLFLLEYTAVRFSQPVIQAATLV